MLNNIQLIGHLGNDPETTYTQAGVAITKFNLATTERWKDKNTGEMQEATEWHRIVFFGKVAEIAGVHLHKGSSVYVSGKMHYDSYTDREGVKRYTADVKADQLRFLDKKRKDGDEDTTSAERKPASAPSAAGNHNKDSSFDDDEIPF